MKCGTEETGVGWWALVRLVRGPNQVVGWCVILTFFSYVVYLYIQSFASDFYYNWKEGNQLAKQLKCTEVFEFLNITQNGPHRVSTLLLPNKQGEKDALQ